MKRYRVDLMDKHWLPFLKTLQSPIPVTADLDPLSLLTDDAQIATWNNEGLPNDRMSTENATILTSAERWPLIIDPQLQGIKWIKVRCSSPSLYFHICQFSTVKRSLSFAVSMSPSANNKTILKESTVLFMQAIGSVIIIVYDSTKGSINTYK